jgi:hypothetical protein
MRPSAVSPGALYRSFARLRIPVSASKSRKPSEIAKTKRYLNTKDGVALTSSLTMWHEVPQNNTTPVCNRTGPRSNARERMHVEFRIRTLYIGKCFSSAKI